jgi:hypothetical protein
MYQNKGTYFRGGSRRTLYTSFAVKKRKRKKILISVTETTTFANFIV